MNIIKVENPFYSSPDNSTIDCTIILDNEESHPFTATATDVELHGQELYQKLIDGDFGEIQAYQKYR